MGNLALRFAAMAVLLASAAAQAQQGKPVDPANPHTSATSGPHPAPPQPDRQPSPVTASTRPQTGGSPSARPPAALGRTSTSPSGTREESRMRESRTHEPEREASSNNWLPDNNRKGEGVHLRVSNYYFPPSVPTAPAQESLRSHTLRGTRLRCSLMPLRRGERRSCRPPSTGPRRVQVCARRPSE